MMLINADNISIKYLDKPLYTNTSFIINDTDKIGIIGINGCGKSTLLKAITKQIELDSGTISHKKDLKIRYLPQEDNFNEEDTILQTFIKETNLEDFAAKSHLSKINLTDYDKKIKEISGGMRKRLSIAICLSLSSDLLILDEPTNHLDIWMINELEQTLIKYNKALLIVTHDRYFLERVTKKIMEIDHQKIYMYEGNYSTYLEEKAKRLENLQAEKRKLAARLRVEAEWASMNAEARRTKSKERFEHIKEMQSRFEVVNKEINDNPNYKLDSISQRMGKTTIEINNISKIINDKVLFSNFSYNLRKLDRIGIIGDNGVGKTTLLKTIIGKITPDSGDVKIGQTIKIGYYDQMGISLDQNIKIIDYLKDYGEYIETPNGRMSASRLLEDYNFSPNFQQQPISKLSGGEKRRLQLLSVLITNPNVLILDEPTNDLDIYTLENLEEFLQNFKGAIIVISHDRYFLDKIIDHLFVFEDISINEYNGIVSDYLETHEKNISNKNITIKQNTEVKQNDIPRFTSKEKKEFDHIEEDIEEIETKINNLKQELNKYTVEYEKIMELNNIINELEEELLNKMDRWEYLNNINNKIIEYNKNKYNI